MYLSTTNGTRAIIAARGAGLMLAGALVNAFLAGDFVVVVFDFIMARG